MKKTLQYSHEPRGGIVTTRFVRSALSALALFAVFCAGVRVSAQTISVNFGLGAGNGATVPSPMDASEVAGVDPEPNWNNAFGSNAGGVPMALVDSTGAATSVTVDWEGSGNTWSSSIPDTPGNNRMMVGYLDTSDTSTTTVTFAGLNASKTYIVYVYDAPAETGRIGGYTIGSQSYYISTTGLFNGTFIRSTSSDPQHPAAGNYAAFTVSGQSSFVLKAKPDTAINGTRAVINGIQIVPLPPPPAPTNLAAVARDRTIALTWDAVPVADSYNVLRSATNGGPYTQIASGILNPSYTDTGLTNGTTYYYVVQAVNSQGASSNSNQASATPKPAVIGTGHIGINFVGGNGATTPSPMDPSEVAGVDPEPNWNNEISNTAGGVPAALVDSAGAPTSVTVDWEGSPNNWSSAVPDIPGNDRMMAGYLDTGNGTTTTVTIAGLDPTKSYLVYVYDAPAETGRVGSYTIGSQSYYIATTSIFNGTFIQATSTDPANPSPGNYAVFTVSGQESIVLNATPDQTVNGTRAVINGIQVVALTLPSAPTNLTATGLNSSIYLSWTGVPVATSYNVLRSTTNGGPYTQVASGVTGTSYTDTGLTNGTTYYYVVQAANNQGHSGNSNQASATPIAAVTGNGDGLYGNYYTGGASDFSAEGNPPFLSRIDPTVNYSAGNGTLAYNPGPWPTGVPSTQFTAAWSGKFLAPYTGPYQFQTITDDGARFSIDLNDGNGLQVQFDDETLHGPLANTTPTVNLVAGQKYNILVEMFQQGGGYTAQFLYSFNGTPFVIAPQSQLFSNITVAPDAPTNLTAIPHNKSAQLYWTGGANAATYNIYRGTAPGAESATPIATGVTNASYLDTGLTNGTTYYYIVKAVNSVGTSTASNEASVVPNATISAVAYWRFEEGTAGAQVPVAPFQVPDLTGHGNTLETPDTGAAPFYSSNVPGPVTNPAAANNLSMDFTTDPVGHPARYLSTTSATGDINTHIFNQFTLEASFNLSVIPGFQTFLGKDGQNFAGDGNGANASLYFQVNGGDTVSCRLHQADGTFILCDGTTIIQPNHWYNAAAVSDGFTLSLYLQSTPGGPYHLEATVPFIGPWADQGLPFSVGRGFYNGGQTDRLNGFVDEVRISDNALDPSLFLFAPSTGATVSGRIALEGVNDLTTVSAGAPLGTFHVSFRTPGTTTEVFGANVTLTPVGAGNPFGTFTVSGVPAGTYDVAIKGSKNLRNVIPNVVVNGSVTLPDQTLLAGDADNNNIVDIGDFGVLVNAYLGDFNVPGSGYDPTADFNFDGKNDIGDFGLLVNNFGTPGAP